MLSKNLDKFIRSLHQAKYRDQQQLFLAEGPKIVKELLHSSYQIKILLALEEWISAHKSLVPREVELIPIKQNELDRISALQTPNSVIAVVHMGKKTPSGQVPENDLFIALDGIRDPGNLGTIIRTADWFGISGIICSPDCVDLFNPKVVQATMGSIARVRVDYMNLAELFQAKPAGLPIYGAVLDGVNLFEQPLVPRGYLVIGSESHGISGDLLPFITHLISIPSYSKGKNRSAESLNASVATAILCAEFRRRSK
jgi:TrmH family RNA methyltransferase